MKISIVIPVYNVGDKIRYVIENIPKIENYEVIIVNDGSTDELTLKTLQELTKQYKDKVQVINHERNCGKGCAMRTGVQNSTGSIIVFIDGDGQHNPKEIPKLIEPILNDEVDFVIGLREIIREGERPLIRKLSNHLSSLLIRLLYNVDIKDSQSGFRAIRRNYIREIDNDRYSVETEMLLKAIKCGARIKEVPVERIYNNASSHFRFSDIIDFIKTIIRYRSYLCEFKY